MLKNIKMLIKLKKKMIKQEARKQKREQEKKRRTKHLQEKFPPVFYVDPPQISSYYVSSNCLVHRR